MQRRTSLIALGSNVAAQGCTPADILRAAIEALHSPDIGVGAVSSFYETPCWPPGAGPDFVNAAAELASGLSPEALLAALHHVEMQLGRVRGRRWGPRCIDLDLIGAGDAVRPDRAGWAAWADLAPERQAETAPEHLILPHPRVQDRPFVLVPLAEIAPDWRHPVLDLTVRELRDRLPATDLAQVRRIAGPR